jgi:hypothetical protein
MKKMGCSCYQQCLNGKELFYAFTGDQKGKLLPESLQRLCPGLLYQLTDMTTDCIVVSVQGPQEHRMDISTEAVSHSAGEYRTSKKILSYYHPPLKSDTVLKENVIQRQIIIVHSRDKSDCKTHIGHQT